ncbi:MAG TPA: hypothetical protein VM638_06490 [Actinomycetota bacterium]|nr:hypothetical protein [Actinomycetota bacterium]
MRRLLLIPLLASLTACLPDEVTLKYGTEPGRRLTYELRLRARIDRTLAGEERRQTVAATFRAQQQITGRSPQGGATALMTLEPRSLTVDGRGQQVGAPQSFEVRIAADGRILQIQRTGEGDAAAEEAEPVAAPTPGPPLASPAADPTPQPPDGTDDPGTGEEQLAPLGIDRLIPRLRPVLPGRPVSPGETWRSVSDFQDEGGRFSLELRSRLAALGLREDRRAALVRTTYSSPVRRREIFSNAVTDIQGEDVGSQEAWFALDGYLIEARGDSVGVYRLLFRPPGGSGAGLEPVEGSLRVRLSTEMRLVGR